MLLTSYAPSSPVSWGLGQGTLVQALPHRHALASQQPPFSCPPFSSRALPACGACMSTGPMRHLGRCLLLRVRDRLCRVRFPHLEKRRSEDNLLSQLKIRPAWLLPCQGSGGGCRRCCSEPVGASPAASGAFAPPPSVAAPVSKIKLQEQTLVWVLVRKPENTRTHNPKHPRTISPEP